MEQSFSATEMSPRYKLDGGRDGVSLWGAMSNRVVRTLPDDECRFYYSFPRSNRVHVATVCSCRGEDYLPNVSPGDRRS
jgi:hypothetical protein